MRIPFLPKWVVTNKFPAFYDFESATAIEQTAKLYGAMQGMIEDYNKFAEEVNKAIEEFVKDINSNQECFEERITKIIHDYIDYMDNKYAEQDKEIKDGIAYMKENLSNSITGIIEEMKEMGELDQAVLDAIDGIGTRVATLETEDADMKTRIDTLETGNADLKARTTTLETGNADLKTRVEELEKIALVYNAETKELNLIINDNEEEGE